MKEISFVQDVFEGTIFAAAACACTVHDDNGTKWVAACFIEVNG